MRSGIPSLKAVAGVLLFLAGVFPAGAATFDIMPTSLFLTPSQTTGVVSFTNHGSKTSYQVRVLHWSQRDGEDVLEPTQDVIASPAIFTTEADQTQIIRIQNRKAMQGEGTYRLLIQELPHAEDGKAVIHMVMRLSLPVMVRPDQGNLAPSLMVRYVGDAVQVSNSGTLTAKLVKIGFLVDGVSPVLRETLRYVLPGSAVKIAVPPDLARPRLGVDLYAEGGPPQHFDVITKVAAK